VWARHSQQTRRGSAQHVLVTYDERN
jgi:hypothetical protein